MPSVLITPGVNKKKCVGSAAPLGSSTREGAEQRRAGCGGGHCLATLHATIAVGWGRINEMLHGAAAGILATVSSSPSNT